MAFRRPGSYAQLYQYGRSDRHRGISRHPDAECCDRSHLRYDGNHEFRGYFQSAGTSIWSTRLLGAAYVRRCSPGTPAAGGRRLACLFRPAWLNPATGIGNVPWLGVVATQAADPDKLVLFCVNRSLTRDLRARITLDGFVPKGAAQVKTLVAPSIYSENDAHESGRGDAARQPGKCGSNVCLCLFTCQRDGDRSTAEEGVMRRSAGVSVNEFNRRRSLASDSTSWLAGLIRRTGGCRFGFRGRTLFRGSRRAVSRGFALAIIGSLTLLSGWLRRIIG